MIKCKTGLVPMFKGEAHRIVLEGALNNEEMTAYSCSDCKKWHVKRLLPKELCTVCGGTVDIIINRGTGICSERCKKNANV